jgi:excisionase family DNA binding protein
MPAPTAAKILGVHQTTLVRWAKQGRIPAYAITGTGRTAWLFDVDEIAAALRANYSAVIRVQRTLNERPILTPEKISSVIQKFRSNSSRK